jgi:Flp pilus assembly protein TadD
VDIQSYEQAGRILLDRGAWRRGHALIVQGIRLDPRNGVLWTLLGVAYTQVGSRGKARAAFEYALAQGDREISRVNMAENLATLYVQQGEYARADSLISSTSGAIPAWLRSYAGAKEAWARGDLDAAHRELLEAARDSLAQSAVYVDLGALEHERGSLDAAEAAYRKALGLNPHQQSARNGLGVVQWARGDLDEAMLRFARLVRANPHNYAAQFNYGGVLLDAANGRDDPQATDSLYALAARRFGVCIDADYQRANALAGRAQAHLRRGDYDAALADARQLARSPAHDEKARLLIARASLSTGNPSEVVQQLEPLYENGSLSQVGLAMLGKAFLEQERYDRAASVLLRAVERGSPSLSVAMNYAVALSESGKLDEAETVLRGLIEEHPNDANLLQNLAAVLQRQGRIVEADRLLMQVNRLEGR